MTDLPKYAHWDSTGTFKIAVAGTSHYRREIASIAQNPDNSHALAICLAYLIPDNQNSHDPNAVRVVIEGKTVGYLPREFAKSYRSYISDLPRHIHLVSAAAAITKGLKTNEKVFEYRVELDIPENLKISVLSEPLDGPPIRVNAYAPLKQSTDGSYIAKVWIPTSDFNELHKTRQVREWTTETWDTVNFYAINRQGIGLGLKVYELPKQQYGQLFKNGPTSGKLFLESGRFATLRIALENQTSPP